MPYLMDTNVASRSVLPADPQYPVVYHAVTELFGRGERLFITPQNLIEFRNMATRPVARNGMGMSVAQAHAEMARMEAIFDFLPDHPDIYPAWELLVAAYAVTGVDVFDARLVAVMQVYGVSHVLTFNTQHFDFYPGIAAVNPNDV